MSSDHTPFQPQPRNTSWIASIRQAIRPILHTAADLFLPRTCVACTKLIGPTDPGLICTLCWSRLAQLNHPQCDRCGHPTTRPDSACSWCALLPPFVRSARSLCWVPHPTASAILYALKYSYWPRSATDIAIRMAHLQWPADVLTERSVIVPVPLAKDRLRERGYNQSALLADQLGIHWCLPVLHALTRNRSTPTQTRLTPADRQRNVAGAFVVSVPKPILAGQHVMLVDDVITTAATLNSCAAALFEGGARIISYVTFGRAHAMGDRH